MSFDDPHISPHRRFDRAAPCSVCADSLDHKKEEMNDKLLDKFPFNEEELARLLEAYDVYKFLTRNDDDDADPRKGTSVDNDEERRDSDDGGEDDDDDRPRLLLLHSMTSFLSDGTAPALSRDSSCGSRSSSSSSLTEFRAPTRCGGGRAAESAAVDKPNLASFSLSRSETDVLALETVDDDDDASYSLGRRRCDLVRSMERSLLPPSFGPALLTEIISTAFVVSSPSDYDSIEDDAWTREQWRDLELFLEGMASATGRRGPRQALRLVYGCCCSTAGTVGGERRKEADAKDLVGLCYRLALAGSALCRLNDGGNATGYASVDIAEQEAARRHGAPKALVGSLLQFTAKAVCQDPESYEGTVPLPCFLDWADAYAPQIHAVLGTLVHSLLLHGCDFPAGRTAFKFPELVVCDEQKGTEKICRSGVWHCEDIDEVISLCPVAFGMATLGPEFCGKWRRLYITESDGASFLSLCHALVGYSGPTVILIRPRPSSLVDEDSRRQLSLFGLYTSCSWEESSDKFYGTDDCLLFRMEPTQEVYRPCGGHGAAGTGLGGRDVNLFDGESSNYVRLHSRTSPGASFNLCSGGSGSSGSGGPSCGLGAGGTLDCPRLFVKESLEGCHANSGLLDRTYERGPLLPGEWDAFFDVDVLEAWAVGTDEGGYRSACESRAARRSVNESVRHKSAHVDRKHFLEDFQNGTVLNSLYNHRDAARGRHDFSVDESHPGSYVL